MQWTHIPIMAKTIADLIITDPSAIYLDCTLGLGGHSKFFISVLNDNGRVIGLDKDAQAIKMAVENISDARFKAYNYSYINASAALAEEGLGLAHGALFDLGLSSYQLDDAARGFSFQQEGPLDMRFDTNQTLTAGHIVNNYSYADLEEILQKYGGETFAPKIAHAVITARMQGPLTSTKHLAKIIEGVCPRQGKLHPATKSFQALRIAVNDELSCVENASKILPSIIKVGGRAAFLTFHSTEDRIIKYALKELAQSGDWKLVNKKVIEPDYEEVKNNPRARSAKLRVIERIK